MFVALLELGEEGIFLIRLWLQTHNELLTYDNLFISIRYLLSQGVDVGLQGLDL